MNKRLKRVIALTLLLILCISNITNIVKATEEEPSLTIINYEHANGSEENKTYAGAKFEIYLVDKNTKTVSQAESYIESNDSLVDDKETNNSGELIFDDLESGRYYVKQVEATKNAVSYAESFLVDLPRTLSNGTELEYNVIVYPKNITLYGTVVLSEKDEEGNNLGGRKWILQKQRVNDVWENYNDETYETNSNGEFQINNLEAGIYRLLEKSANDEYIIDLKDVTTFTIDAENLTIPLNIVREKVSVEKYVMLSDGTYGKHVGAFKQDVVSWKTVATVPSMVEKLDNYIIEDSIGNSVEIVDGTFKVIGVNSNGSEQEISSSAYQKTGDSTKTLKFNTSNISGLKQIVIKYDTKFKSDVVTATNVATAKCTYDTFIDADGNVDEDSKKETDLSSAEVHMGGTVRLNVDQNNNNVFDAKFKIATSLDNAKNKIFMKDKNGKYLEYTIDFNGHTKIDGFKYGADDEDVATAKTSYWLVETYAPTKYELIEKPIEIQINKDSYDFTSNMPKIIHIKRLKLPATGGIGALPSIILSIVLIFISILKFKKENKEKVLEIDKKI